MKKHVAIVIKKEDKYIFVKRASTKKTLQNIWSFPSGTVEENELPIQTAIRETKEELNLDVNFARVLPEIRLWDMDIDLIPVICEVEDFLDMKLDEKEISEVRLIKLETFFDFFPDEEIGHGLRLIRKNRSLIE